MKSDQEQYLTIFWEICQLWISKIPTDMRHLQNSQDLNPAEISESSHSWNPRNLKSVKSVKGEVGTQIDPNFY